MSTETPEESLFARLRESMADLAPDAVLEQMRPVIERFTAQFELVPKRDYDAHLATLGRLEATVGDLEARIAELERTVTDL